MTSIVPPFFFNVIHIFVLAPLFLYISFFKQDTANFAFDILKYLTFVMIPFHAYRWYTSMRTETIQV